MYLRNDEQIGEDREEGKSSENQNQSMHDPEFQSFVNSTHNLDFDAEFEAVFHNEALSKLLSKKELKDLNNLIDKPVFVDKERNQPISLLGAAQNRYSDQLLGQVYKMQLELDITHNSEEIAQNASGRAKEASKKLVTFNRSEIYFNDRKSVMLILRDLSKGEDMVDAARLNRLLKCVYESLEVDLVGSFSSINYICEVMVESQGAID